MENNIFVLEAWGPCGMACLEILQKHPEYHVIALDSDVNSPAKQFCHSFEVIPLANDQNFWIELQKLIDRYNPLYILPSFEHWFDICKELQGNFLTDFYSAILCKNKYHFYDVCKNKQLPVIETYLLNEYQGDSFPLYVKPLAWVWSRDNFIVKDNKQLEWVKLFLWTRTSDFIIQPFIQGRHRNVDILVDESGFFLSAIPRLDIKQSWWNCITVEIQEYKELIAFSKEVTGKLQIKSPFNLEVFEIDKWSFLINEINVRFWWGIIFWAMAGMDFLSYILTKDPKYIQWYKKGKYSRYLKAIKI